MSNPKELLGNDFTDELYNAIYTKIQEVSTWETDTDRIENQLGSPQKERFLLLFVELSMKNKPLDTNSVFRVCHKLLEKNESHMTLTSCLNNKECIDQTNDSYSDINKMESSIDADISYSFRKTHDNRCVTFQSSEYTMTLTEDKTRLKFEQELFFNLIQCSQGTAEWTRTDVNSIPCLESVVRYVNEFGRLHNIIKDYLINTDDDNGRVVNTLRFVLQNKLNSYYVNVYLWIRSNLDVLQHPIDSLHKLIPLDYNFLTEVQCLAEIAKNAKNNKGCNLISSLIRTRLLDILYEVIKPIQELIVRWMTDGEIEDKYDEFFIVVTSSDNYWDNSHTLSSKNMLDFLNTCQVNDIYQIGKNMRFLLKVLGSKFNNKIENLRRNILNLVNEDTLLIMLSDKYNKISILLSDAHEQSCNLLMEVLINNYDLFLHFEGYRNYMLFGRGDFYSYVLYKLDPYFGKNEMHHYQLKDIIKNAYELTSAENDCKKLFDNLKYRIVYAGKLNWNSFKFEYVTDEPLNQIFGPFLNHYAKVFEFLWRLKNVDWTINKTWREFMCFIKKFDNTIELKLVLRNINSLLSNMMSFANNIQTFMFETINDEWERFKNKTCGATCVKTAINAHMLFLEIIMKCVDNASVSLNAYVESLKENIEKFVNIFRRFVVTTKAESNCKKLVDEMKTFVDGYEAVKKTFETELCELLSKLTNNEIQGLGRLALRIDFNGYYSTCNNNNLINVG